MKTKVMMVVVFCFFFAQIALATELKVMTNNWEPYYGEKMKNGGPIIEIVRMALKEKGYGFSVKHVPWKRAIEFCKKGKIDIVIGTWPNADRVEYFAQSDMIVSNTYGLFKRKDVEINYTNCEEVKNVAPVVGNVRGYLTPKCLIDAGVEIEESDNDEMTIKKLIGKRYNLALNDKIFLFYYLDKHLPAEKDKIEWVATLEEYEMGISISKANPKWEEILKDFNDALKQLKENGEFTRIMESHGLSQ